MPSLSSCQSPPPTHALVWEPTEVNQSHLDHRSESSGLFLLLQGYWWEVWLKVWLTVSRVWSLGVLGIKMVTNLVVLCLYLDKEVLPSSSPFGLSCRFSIPWVAFSTLSCVLFLLCLYFFLPNISNPHTPTLEHRDWTQTHYLGLWHCFRTSGTAWQVLL